MINLRSTTYDIIQTAKEEVDKPYQIPRGEDPTGKMQRLANEWRPYPRPKFYRVDERGALHETRPEIYEEGDFMEVTGFLDLVVKEKYGG